MRMNRGLASDHAIISMLKRGLSGVDVTRLAIFVSPRFGLPQLAQVSKHL